MVRTARLVGVCLLLLSHSVLLHADVIPGRWEKVEAQTRPIHSTVFALLRRDFILVFPNSYYLPFSESGRFVSFVLASTN